MKKEAVGKIQPIKKSNNNLILAIIIIILLLLVVFVLVYLGYNYLVQPIEPNETEQNDSYINDTIPVNDSGINDTSRPPVCGDGKCTGKESYTNCPADCKKPTGPGGGGGDNPPPSCTPNCAGKQCGSNGCGGTCSPGCGAGYECNSTGNCALIPCTNETGCNARGMFCSGNMPYNCTNTDLDICLERINLTVCAAGWQCMNGSAAGCEEIKDCTAATVASNCSSFFGACSYGICNSTFKCEIVYNQTGLCREASGDCGAVEYCAGNSAACPADANLSGNICRASTGACDVSDRCNGLTNSCPADIFNLSTTLCRNNISECDAREFCIGGNNANCPADANKTNGEVCFGGLCQSGKCILNCVNETGCSSVGQFCSGNTPYICSRGGDGCLDRTDLAVCAAGWQCIVGSGCEEIPQCNFDSDCNSLDNVCSYGICNSTKGCEVRYNQTADLCRASTGPCDYAAKCTGTSAACPTNPFNLSTTICRASTGVCDAVEKCSGSSAACPNDIFNLSTTICRNNISECDAQEFCNGNPACPADVNKSNGETCFGGTCQSGKCVCILNCAGKECGDNGCGGTCPPGCAAGETCNSAGQCILLLETPIWCGFHALHTTYSDGVISLTDSVNSLKTYYDCGSTNDHDTSLDQTEWTNMINTANSNNVNNNFTYFFGAEWSGSQHIHYITMNPSSVQKDAADVDFNQVSELASWLSKNSGVAQHNHPARTSGGTDFSNPANYNETWIPLVEIKNANAWHWNYYWDCATGSGCSTSVNPYIPSGQVAGSTGWIKYALDKGIHLGFSCGNDDHSALPFTPNCYTGLANAKTWTREGVYEALKARNTWAAEDKIWMDLRANNGFQDFLMGDIFNTTSSSITIRYYINATPGNTITKVNLFYNGVIVNVSDYSKQNISGSITQSLTNNKEDYLFIEAIQSNGKRAWSSPIWVTYQACTPSCAGKQCGSDGCGGTCAPGCAAGETCSAGQCVLAGSFNFENKRLNISTSTMDLGIEGGAVVYVKDKASGETLINTSPWTNRPSFSQGFVPSSTTPVTFSQSGSNKGRLTYTISTGKYLYIDVAIDSSGEILLNLTGTGSGIGGYMDIPLMNFQKQSVILGNGHKYVRSDADTTMTNNRGSLTAPNMVVLEGSNSVISAWPEAVFYNSIENIQLQHKTGYDNVILQTKRDPNNTNPNLILSTNWRIGTYSAWNKAAKRWRVKFEERTGAKPLWENRAEWVRDVHAVFYPRGDTSDASYSALRDMIVPHNRLLMFLWQGNRIVLYGDHTLAAKIALPTDKQKQLMAQNGWPLMLYHPYFLIYNEEGVPARLNELSSSGYLPAGYQFNPDYESTAANWFNYWSSDIRAYYGQTPALDVIHPGSTKFKNYIVRNFANYCDLHKCNGSYFDVLGVDAGNSYFKNIPIVEGQDYVAGEESAIRKIVEARPDLAIMSEYQAPWQLHQVFYSWESTRNHMRSSDYLNHPLRVALSGSYSWLKEDNYINFEGVDMGNDVQNALLGTLPLISIGPDLGEGAYPIPEERKVWSQARGKLFCDEELFNDIPDTWDSDALAYYKSQRTGNWFKAIVNNGNFQYVEKFSDGKQTIRLSNNSINTRVCNEGAITSECFCGMASYNSGYCCNHQWKSTACTAALASQSDTSLSSRIIDFFKNIFTGNVVKDITGYFIKS